jgi:uncharacterized 2Fe-2S/4Fe-4S cluster protein (DUF4445 family)
MPDSKTKATVSARFEPSRTTAATHKGANLLDVALAAGVEIAAPCGGQGRCGRCRVVVEEGAIERRPTPHISDDDVAAGHVLCCQTIVAGDVVVRVPLRKAKETGPRHEVRAEPQALPATCDWRTSPAIRTFDVVVEPPTLTDNTSDLDRLRREFVRQFGIGDLGIELPLLRSLGRTLRESAWHVAVTLEMGNRTIVPNVPPRILAVAPHDHPEGTYGLAVDVGTTSVVVYLIDFASANVVATASAYNGQIACGDDIISRIVYSQRDLGLKRLQDLIIETINDLIEELARSTGVRPAEIYEIVAAGNTTMIHLLLGLDPKYLREAPYTPTVSYPSQTTAGELGLAINPQAGVRCMPSVGSYVGGDITAGVLSSGMFASDQLTLFIDIGTNGEMVLGNRDWMISCACSAGPAFEGGGVANGMRATAGAIEEVWVDPETLEATFTTIDGKPAMGICGSGLIGLLGELFIAGVIDKSGRIRRDLDSPRVRDDKNGPEYVVAWSAQTGIDQDITLRETDINNLIRAKAAIYAGFSVLCRSVGVDLAAVEQILIGGAFGEYIDSERAIEIGLLPDVPLDRFRFLGNTSALGAYIVLLCTDMRREIIEVASKMTYLELSADNAFMDEYMSALFLPHTHLENFPSVQALLDGRSGNAATGRSDQ